MTTPWDEWQERLSQWWAMAGNLPLRILAALAIGLLLHWILIRVLRQITRRSSWTFDERLLLSAQGTSRWLVLLLALLAVPIDPRELHPEYIATARHVISLLLIAVTIRLLLRLTSALDQHVKSRHPIDGANIFEARRIHTQTTVLRRTADVFLIFVGVAIAVMTFPRARELGAGLLASAGIIGIVVGLAVRPILENLLAGLQIALTQPIKIQDSVFINGEMGTIEEINSTYVVVRIWDERRLVVPLSKFIQEPFQNWTRHSSQILGVVYLYADYSLPVEALREQLMLVVANSEKWDGRVCKLQVTDATEKSIQLRALVSAATSGEAWELRVHVREKLIEFLQREYPHCLPKSRIELGDRSPETAAPARG